MVLKTYPFLARAPSLPDQSINIGPSHRKSMIKTKQRVVFDLFKLALAGCGTSAAFEDLVSGLREVSFDVFDVMGVHVGLNHGFNVDEIFDIFKKPSLIL